MEYENMEKNENENFVDIHVSFSLNDLGKLAEALAEAMTTMTDCDHKLVNKNMIHSWLVNAFCKDDETPHKDTPKDTKTETETTDTETENSSSGMSDWD